MVTRARIFRTGEAPGALHCVLSGHVRRAIPAAAGFEQVRWEDLSFGIAALHVARKPADRQPEHR